MSTVEIRRTILTLIQTTLGRRLASRLRRADQADLSPRDHPQPVVRAWVTLKTCGRKFARLARFIGKIADRDDPGRDG